MAKNKKKKGPNLGSDFEEHRKKVGKALYSKGKNVISYSREAVRKEIRDIVGEAKQKKDEMKKKVSHAAKNGIKDLKIDGNRLLDFLKDIKFKESPSKSDSNPETHVVQDKLTSANVSPVEKIRIERKDKQSYYDIWYHLIESEIRERLFGKSVSEPVGDYNDNEIQENKDKTVKGLTNETISKQITVDKTYLKYIPSGTYRKTYEMLVKGIAPEEIASLRSLSSQTIYSHIAFFIERGYLDIFDFISQSTYDEVHESIRKVGVVRLSDIKQLCNDDITYSDIKMVIADLKYQNDSKYEDYEKAKSDWYFVDSVPFTKTSKYFLSCDCRVVLSELGYYLEVNDEYIKLGDYPKGFNHNEGNAWIKKPINDKGYRMVHENKTDIHLIGYIREDEDMIVYTNPNDEEYTIPFNED